MFYQSQSDLSVSSLEIDDKSAGDNDVFQDGAIVVSLPVPSLPRANSAPEFLTLVKDKETPALANDKSHADNNTISKANATGDVEKSTGENTEEKKNELTKAELLKNYRLHIFVGIIFIIIVLSVSLSWHFKTEAQEKLYASQAIFYNPRTRELTLSDTSKNTIIKGLLGLDLPMWLLPLHCPIVMGGNPHYKECLWKRMAVLRIAHFHYSEIQCYNISWESLGPRHVPHDCYYINTGRWYGPSNQSMATFPIEGEFEYNPANVTFASNGIFDTVVDFYWLSSLGTAIYVDANDPIHISWNISGSNQLCLRSNYSGPLYHKTNAIQHPVINYTVCQGSDAKQTHLYMQKMFAPKDKPLPDSVLRGVHWSVKSVTKMEDASQSNVTDLLNNIKRQGFKENILTLDGNWQRYQGDLVFDADRFSNVTEMIAEWNDSNTLLTLGVSPHFLYMSQNFHYGVESNIFVKDAGGEVTGLTNFRGKLAAVLDVFTEPGKQWFQKQLQNLVDKHQIKSYRLSYGHRNWLPYKPHFENVDATPNMYRKHISDLLSQVTNVSLIMEHTSESRHMTSLIPVTAVISADGKCLTGLIETALTLGLMGYPYVMADGFRLQSEQAENESQASYKPSKELYIRWLQLVSLFPAYQFSIAPWEYDQEVVFKATNLSVQRDNVIIKEMKKEELQRDVQHGYPILRPVWWLHEGNHSVHDLKVTDEFLIGDTLLIAPVLCVGTTERDVYVPPGVWENVDTKSIVLGPATIRIPNITIESIVMFQRRPVAGEVRRNPDL